VKKLCIYRVMSSDLFINYSLPTMRLLYKVFGTKLTNVLINKSAGEVFTSGEEIQSVVGDIAHFEKRGITGVANYVAEGLHEMNESTIQTTLKDLMDTIEAVTKRKQEGHLAIKITALISIDIMTRLSKA